MAKQHIVSITNGIGSKELANGNYSVTSSITGYDNSTITPDSVEISEGLDNYEFTVSATGTLILHVSDDGTDIGIPIVGAKFYRCDASGNTYGDAVVSDDEGNATFNNVPYSTEGNAPNVYYKQTISDGEHEFTSELQTATLEEESVTIEISNLPAVERTINLTDAYYSGLPIENGEITLSEQE